MDEQATGFGPILKRLRESAGLSQGALAEKAGMNLWGIAKLEQELRDPKWSTVMALAQALDVSVVEFVPLRAKKPSKK